MSEPDYFSEEGKALFHKRFWEEKVDRKDDPRVTIVDGVHYLVGAEPAVFGHRESDHLGHGGRKFKIRYHDGREITTHNLWCQGEIPEEFRDRLPNNADFV